MYIHVTQHTHITHNIHTHHTRTHNTHTHHTRTHTHTHNAHTQYEAIPESLKNMLLVMVTQGVFDMVPSNSSLVWDQKHLILVLTFPPPPPPSPSHPSSSLSFPPLLLPLLPSSSPSAQDTSHKLWLDTWSKLDQFLPGFLHELFPRVTPPASSVTMEIATSSPPPPTIGASPQGSPSHPVRDSPHGGHTPASPEPGQFPQCVFFFSIS